MLNFLRKLRRNNKNSKYLRYAVGEIVLVVIGILIALSINNWNEERKDRIYETKILGQISIALEEDVAYFERMISRLERLDSSLNKFIFLIDDKVDFIDSLYNKTGGRWYLLRTGIVYNYNRGPYESLRSSGLDKLKNDSIRNLLVKLYDFEFIRNKEFIDFYERDYERQTEKLESFQGPPFIETANGIKSIKRKFPADLLRNPEFLEVIDEIKNRSNLELRALNDFIPLLKEVHEDIKKELKNR